ncbi:hypothetical protein FHG87_024458 [Trinorchestia longiramus]|nr:hypothetical protein FHG87_024458 [Trinorchestia longiramus]
MDVVHEQCGENKWNARCVEEDSGMRYLVGLDEECNMTVVTGCNTCGLCTVMSIISVEAATKLPGCHETARLSRDCQADLREDFLQHDVVLTVEGRHEGAGHLQDGVRLPSFLPTGSLYLR